MTSSLVGSEMCIRDSSSRLVPFWILATIPINSASHDDRAVRLCFPDRQDTVSYTHLTLPTICSV
eukprot:1676502-Prorocentrum_lima.AAC.1